MYLGLLLYRETVRNHYTTVYMLSWSVTIKSGTNSADTRTYVIGDKRMSTEDTNNRDSSRGFHGYQQSQRFNNYSRPLGHRHQFKS